MITWHQLLKEGRERLYQAGQSEQAAMYLLNELCSAQGINLYMDMDEPAREDIQTEYLEGIHRMELQEPLGYILGYENFYGYDFIVNENVLIPRPETEELTGQVLMLCDEAFPDTEHPILFDVATGSGAIGITLSLENPDLKVYASDISDKALEVATANNEKLGGRVTFFEGDMLRPFIDRGLRCDILVSNPPYIPAEEQMEKSVVDFEPHVALFGGEDGLFFYRKIFRHAHEVLHDGGIMAFEIGYDQGERLQNLAREYFPDAGIEILQDVHGKDRMLIVRMPKRKKEVHDSQK